MNILTTKEYGERKKAFLNRHNDWEVYTSDMNEYGQYHKTFVCEDNAQWIEINRPVWKKVKVEVCKVEVEVEVKLFETEGWSTDDANSIFCYEKF